MTTQTQLRWERVGTKERPMYRSTPWTIEKYAGRWELRRGFDRLGDYRTLKQAQERAEFLTSTRGPETVTFDALAALNETRNKLEASIMHQDPFATWTTTQQQLAGVMHFLSDMLVDQGWDRDVLSTMYGFGRMARKDARRR